MYIRMRLLTLLVGALSASFQTQAFAWTRPAHMVSAAIAYDDLIVRDSWIIDTIADLMSHHPDPGPFQVAIGRATGADRTQRVFLEMARWPDDVRGGFQDHPTWHYAFRPYVDPRDPPSHKPADVISGSAYSALALNVEMASDPRAAPGERAVALCWIFHIVGDIHQPLHATELFSKRFPACDHGGGLEYVLDPDTRQPEVFHWYWDDSVHRVGEPLLVLARAR
jgi:S1/P1 Nuclease